MKSLRANAITAILLSTGIAGAIPWPILPTGETHSLFHSYGDFHREWASTDPVNFHYGIDIADPSPLSSNYEPVHSVAKGTVVRVQEPGNLGWFAIIEDDETPVVNGDAWIYEHIQGLPVGRTLPQPCFLNQPFDIGDVVGYIAHVYDPVPGYGRIFDHLHLMRADEPASTDWLDWTSSMPASLNPLFYLNPSPTITNGFDWSWVCDASMSPPISYMFFALPQYTALTQWGATTLWADAAECQEEADTIAKYPLTGEVDLFLYFYVKGEGDNGPSPLHKSMPQRLKWWIEWDNNGTWTDVMADGNTYYRYLFDFGDIPLGGSDDADAYKQLYFRFSPGDMGIGGGGYLCCLTNVSDNQNFSGIANITENCWNTKASKSGSGDAISGIDAVFPDGNYRICWEASAFNGTASVTVVTPSGYTSSNSVEVEVANCYPLVTCASISSSATDEVYWDAEWETVETTDGYEMQFVVNTHESVIPTGQNIDVEIHFSESMDPDCTIPPAYIGIQSENGGWGQALSGTWSGTTVENDTWTGTATLPTVLLPGRLSLLVSWQDLSGEWLENPADPGLPFMDNYHGVDIAYEAESGWPVSIHDELLSSPKLADIDLDGDLDIIIQTADGWVDVLDDDGSSMSGWPVSGGWSSGDPDVYASPAIVNLSGISSSAPEILAVHPYGCNGFMADGSAISPWSSVFGYMFRWFVYCSPVAGDFDENGSNDFVLGRQHVQPDPAPYVDINLMARTNTGSPLWMTNWGSEYNEESVSATPCLADVDNDGNLEVVALTDGRLFPTDVVGNVYCVDATSISVGDEKWVTNIGASELNKCAVVAGNLDGDNYLEIVVIETAGTNSIKVLDGFSGDEQYTRSIVGSVESGASIADIDGDGNNDIVVSSSGGMLYCWDGPTGNSLSGFPVDLDTWTREGVSIGDIDGDGMLEIVIAGRDGKLHAINHDGTSTGGFPITVSSNPLSGQPALGDIDGDGRLEIVFGEAGSSVLHCYELADNSAYAYLPWPQFQRDAQNTGYFPTDNTPPGAPSNLSETHSWTGDVVDVNLSWSLSPDDPGDVIGYRIFGGTPPDPASEIEVVAPGTTGYSHRMRVQAPYTIARYYLTAIDGVNESSESNDVRIPKPSVNNLALNCPVREILTSADISSSGSTSIDGGTRTETSASRSESNYRVLTDGGFTEAYIPADRADCVEVDLGGVFTVDGVITVRSDQSLCDTPRYELSSDGRSFSRVDSGRARYVRIYGAAGATEIEVLGERGESSSAPVEIGIGEGGGFRITAVEQGNPMEVTVFDLMGRSIWSESSSTGEVLWNRCSITGGTVPSGIYLLLIETEDSEPVTAKVIVR